MSDPKRSSLAPTPPRASVPTTPSPHGVGHSAAHAAEFGAHASAAAYEVAHQHSPVGFGVDLYKRFTNAAIKSAAPPGALNAPLVQNVLRTRNAVLTAAAVGLTAFGVYQSWKHSKGKGDGH